MSWPAFDSFAWKVPPSPGMRIRTVRPSDVTAVVRALVAWYPDITVGAESVFLDPAFYGREVALSEDSDAGVIAFIMEAGTELVAFCAAEYNPQSRTLHGRLGAVAPAYRARGLSEVMAGLLEDVGRAVGAELLLSYATLRHRYSQQLLERVGYRLVGIVPAHDRDAVEPGKVRRVFEALYAKVLVDSSGILPPDDAALLPNTRALMRQIFGT
jgi:hypothetical protein